MRCWPQRSAIRNLSQCNLRQSARTRSQAPKSLATRGPRRNAQPKSKAPVPLVGASGNLGNASAPATSTSRNSSREVSYARLVGRSDIFPCDGIDQLVFETVASPARSRAGTTAARQPRWRDNGRSEGHLQMAISGRDAGTGNLDRGISGARHAR